jgi:hypothetical protein
LVADAYLDIMSRLGVGINLAKSVIASNPTFEFAKVTGHYGKDVSALPWKAFVSQMTRLGRVNIAFSLLRRRYNLPHWVSWFKALTAISPKKQSSDSFDLIALWTMYAKSGFVSYDVVFASLVNIKEPGLRLYRSFLLNCNTDYIFGCISKILSGRALTPHKSYRHEIEELWIRNSLVKPLYMHSANFSDHELVEKLAKGFIKTVVPVHLVPDHTLTVQVNFTWSEYESMVNAVYLCIYSMFWDLVDKPQSEFKELPTAASGRTVSIWDLPINDILRKQELVDQISSLSELFDRANEKLSGSKVLNKKPTSLSVIKSLLQANRYRPNWTKKVGLE